MLLALLEKLGLRSYWRYWRNWGRELLVLLEKQEEQELRVLLALGETGLGATGATGSYWLLEKLGLRELLVLLEKQEIRCYWSSSNGCFRTDQSIGNNDFFGLGTSSADFIRNTIVIPRDSRITSLTFNIRDEVLAAGDTATATIYISTDCGVTETPTSVVATITGNGTQIVA